ncbi:RRQRL motif-containing zinc-binding protein [Streptomyces marincola]|uniref:Uncharacterized protein n=1 Tax=Streptomyces marincola TaxID=2878388 RepID=A0A1W7CYJ3_9ACTN|nr:RRQRL motif-containing zinc-binding protein [Streptomyces marincola]ARQ69739.1 hypothetical protein CAG99_13470 [Streptomyces marincola]
MSTLPVYPWRCAPDGLATYRQLRARGLRPGGQEPVGQIERRRRRGRPPLTGLLYRIDQAVPVRPMTPGRWRAIEAALRARRTCPQCGCDRGYCIPTSIGRCNECDAAGGWSTAA